MSEHLLVRFVDGKNVAVDIYVKNRQRRLYLEVLLHVLGKLGKLRHLMNNHRNVIYITTTATNI